MSAEAENTAGYESPAPQPVERALEDGDIPQGVLTLGPAGHTLHPW